MRICARIGAFWYVTQDLTLPGSLFAAVSRSLLLSFDTAKPDVAHRGVDRFWMARGGPIAPAVIRRAQVGAAFQNFPGYLELCLARVVALILGAARADSLECSTPSLRRPGAWARTSRWSTPIRCRSCRRGRSRSPGMCRPATCARTHRASVFSRGNSPCQVLAICLPPGANSSPQANSAPSEPAARGKLPLGFGRQLLAGPLGIGFAHPCRRRARPDDRRGP